MKQLLFIHDVPKEKLSPANSEVQRGSYSQNVAFCWMNCFDWLNGESECQQWGKATVEECLGYRYVMLWLLTEPGNGPKYVKMLELLRGIKASTGRKTKVIAYADGPVGWGYQHNSLPLELKGTFLAICREADFMFCYSTPESMGYWRAVRQGHDVFALDRPQPVDEASGEAIEPSRKRGDDADPDLIDIPWEVDCEVGHVLANAPRGPYLGLAKGVNNVCEERGIFVSLAVAKYAQDTYGFTPITHTHTPIDGDPLPYYREIAGLDRIIEIRLKSWRDYLRDLSRCYVAVHMDVLETRGQFALDCASLGIPLICSSSVAGQKLFPLTYIRHPRDVDMACEKLNRLLGDQEYYDHVRAYARHRLQDYSCQRVRAKFDEVVNGRPRG